MKDIYRLLAEQAYDDVETRTWLSLLPNFNFDKNWNVKILPSYFKTVIRFYIQYKQKRVFVFATYPTAVATNDDLILFSAYENEIKQYNLKQSEMMMNHIREYLDGEEKQNE